MTKPALDVIVSLKQEYLAGVGLSEVSTKQQVQFEVTERFLMAVTKLLCFHN